MTASAMTIPGTILYFTIYDELRELVGQHLVATGRPAMPVWVPAVCGGATSTVTAIVLSPLEMIRTKCQSQRLSYMKVGQSLCDLVKAQGYRSLWRGLDASLLRVIPFSCIYWSNYELLKARFSADANEPTFAVSFVCGAGAGAVAAALTIPFDVAKTHRQIDWTSSTLNQSVYQILRNIYQNHGLRGLFVGLAPRVIREAPASAIMISVFEVLKTYFRRQNALQKS